MSRSSAWFTAAAFDFLAFAAAAVADQWVLAGAMVAIGIVMLVLGFRASAQE